MRVLTGDVIDYDDFNALCGGVDGLDVIRDIVTRFAEWCNDTSACTRLSPTCWMEINPSHPIQIGDLISSNSNVGYISTMKDFMGHNRFVKLRLNQTFAPTVI